MKKFISVLCMITLILNLNIIALANSSDKNEVAIVYPETQMLIKNVVDQCNVDETYFDNIVATYQYNGYEDYDLLNETLVEAANSILNSYNNNQIDLQKAIDEYNEVVQNSNRTRSSIDSTLYYSTLENYGAGITVVRLAGCPNTADAMEHAVVPIEKVGTSWNPDALNYNNDEWATFLCTRTAFWSYVEEKFQVEVLPTNELKHTFTGSFEFTTSNSSLDAYVQLHNVNYVVTFIRNSDYTYSASFYLSDTYDFQWNNYNSIAVDFGNNYAYMAQSLGIIAPYPIYCTFTM